jgi:hypothetical protein
MSRFGEILPDEAKSIGDDVFTVNAIHKWLVDHCNDGEYDDIVQVKVAHAQLEELLNLCREGPCVSGHDTAAN